MRLTGTFTSDTSTTYYLWEDAEIGHTGTQQFTPHIRLLWCDRPACVSSSPSNLRICARQRNQDMASKRNTPYTPQTCLNYKPSMHIQTSELPRVEISPESARKVCSIQLTFGSRFGLPLFGSRPKQGDNTTRAWICPERVELFFFFFCVCPCIYDRLGGFQCSGPISPTRTVQILER